LPFEIEYNIGSFVNLANFEGIMLAFWQIFKNGLHYTMIFLKKYYEFLMITVLTVFFLVTGFTSLTKKSLTFDESVHIAGGYSALSYGDFRINPENGILPQVWAASPLIFQKNITPPNREDHFWSKISPWDIANKFLFKSGHNYDFMIMISRCMMLAVAAGGGIALYFVSKTIWGRGGGRISLVLFVLSPTIMANSRLVTSDIFAALFFFFSVWFFHLILNRFSIFRLIAMSICVAALFLSKMSAPLIVPVILIMIVIRLYSKKPWHVKIHSKHLIIKEQWKQALCFLGALSIAGVVTFAAMWGSFGFRYSMRADNKAQLQIEQNWNQVLQANKFPQKVISFAKDHKVLPEAYLYGLGYVLYQARLRYAFLNGQYSSTGWWYFFPLTFMMKTPLSILLISLMGLINIVNLRSKSERNHLRIIAKLKQISPFLILICVYIAFSLTTNLNIGHRHLLVIYPPLFLIAGGAYNLVGRRVFAKLVLYLLFAILFFENLLIYPDYLSYFSPVVGGTSQGYKHLVDSSLDWGQDLKGLKEWLKRENIPTDKTYISYFGSVNLNDYGMPQKKLLCCFEQNSADIFELKEGYYCISATMLQMVYYPEFAHWNSELEQMLAEYRIAFRVLYKKINTDKDPVITKDFRLLIKKFRLYEKLRFAKLADLLRSREPDVTIGHSILIFYVTQNKLTNLFGQELNSSR